MAVEHLLLDHTTYFGIFCITLSNWYKKKKKCRSIIEYISMPCLSSQNSIIFLIHGWIKSLGLLGPAHNHHMPVHIPLAAVPVVLIKLLNVYKYRLHTVSAVKPAVCLETSHYTCAFSDCEPEKGRLTVCQVIDKKCQDLTTTNFF